MFVPIVKLEANSLDFEISIAIDISNLKNFIFIKLCWYTHYSGYLVHV